MPRVSCRCVKRLTEVDALAEHSTRLLKLRVAQISQAASLERVKTLRNCTVVRVDGAEFRFTLIELINLFLLVVEDGDHLVNFETFCVFFRVLGLRDGG